MALSPGLQALLERLDLSFDQIREKLRLSVDNGAIWVRDVYESWFVYEPHPESRTFRRSYSLDPDTGEVALGEPIEVVGQFIWVPLAQEAQSLELGGDLIPLVESTVRQDGTIPIKIIAPGWGSSGYYPEEVLQRDGPRVFKAGLHTYWNHPSKTEAKDRPERDLRDLAGVLSKDAYYDPTGPAGPGLYGEAAVVSQYRENINELAPYIGMSIRAFGNAVDGEVNGRKGKIVQDLVAAQSVDFVTAPGAGGKILELFEAAGRTPAEGDPTVTEQEAEALRQENARLTSEVQSLKEAHLRTKAREVAAQTLATTDLPEAARTRLLGALPTALPLTEAGELDTEALTLQVQEKATAETEYIKAIRGTQKSTGQVQGLGASTPVAEAGHQALLEAFTKAGLSPELAEVAAKGR